MVRGLPKFREHFRDCEQEYVLIGGAACDQWFGARSLQFRATRDLDIVLLVEALSPSFLRSFWAFVKDGGYRTRERASGSHEYFRFLRPERNDYPAKLEIFSRQPDGIELFEGQEIVPIAAGEDVSSLSAILMDDSYYSLILDTREASNHLPMVRIEGLIPLKARAWLDMTRRKMNGEHIDADDIKKHRNDVFRLALLLPTQGRTDLPDAIRADLREFSEAFPGNSQVWQGITAALRNTIRQPPAPDIILQSLADHFAL